MIKDKIYNKRELIVQTQRELVGIDERNNSLDSSLPKELDGVHKNTLSYTLTPQENTVQYEAYRRKNNQSEGRSDKQRTDETRNITGNNIESSSKSFHPSKNSSSGKIRFLDGSKSSMKSLKGLQVRDRDKLENAALLKLIEGYKDFMLKINLSFNLVVKAQRDLGLVNTYD